MGRDGTGQLQMSHSWKGTCQMSGQTMLRDVVLMPVAH